MIPGLNYASNKRSSQRFNSFDMSSTITASQQSKPLQPMQPMQPMQQTRPTQPMQQQFAFFEQQTQSQQKFSPQKQKVLPGQVQTPGFQVQQNFSVPPPNNPPPQINQARGQSDGMKKLVNPLKAQFDFKIMCKQCLVPSSQLGLYVHKTLTHNCEQNVLAMYKKGNPSVLMRVRERTNHRDFPGRYIICNSVVYNKPDICRFGSEKCSFAHNRVEQILWTQEKEGNFNVSEFILQNRSAPGGATGYTVAELLNKHGGQFRFICQQCFNDRPPRIAELGRPGFCATNRHPWESSKVLAHFAPLGGITIIKRRVFIHKSAYFKICHWMFFCKKSINGICPFAHSMVERDVWMCERDGDLSQEQVVDKCNAIIFGHHHGNGLLPMPSQPQDNIPAQPYPAGVSQPTFPEMEKPAKEPCPYNVQVLCGTCWKTGTCSKQDGSQDKCFKGHNHWQHIKIFMLMPDLKEIRPLPLKIPVRLNFVICKYILAKKKCDYSLGGPCQFAHSEKEKDVWFWMCRNNSKFTCSCTLINKIN